MKFRTVRDLGIGFLLLFAAGCSSYYRITDQATGRIYYTTDYDRRDNGGVVFEDAKSSAQVTSAVIGNPRSIETGFRRRTKKLRFCHKHC